MSQCSPHNFLPTFQLDCNVRARLFRKIFAAVGSGCYTSCRKLCLTANTMSCFTEPAASPDGRPYSTLPGMFSLPKFDGRLPEETGRLSNPQKRRQAETRRPLMS